MQKQNIGYSYRNENNTMLDRINMISFYIWKYTFKFDRFRSKFNSIPRNKQWALNRNELIKVYCENLGSRLRECGLWIWNLPCSWNLCFSINTGNINKPYLQFQTYQNCWLLPRSNDFQNTAMKKLNMNPK